MFHSHSSVRRRLTRPGKSTDDNVRPPHRQKRNTQHSQLSTEPEQKKGTPSKDQKDQPIPWKETFAVIFPYIIPNTRRQCTLAAISIFCTVLSKTASLLPPYSYKLVVDSLSENVGHGTITVPYKAVALNIGAKLVTPVIDRVGSFAYNKVTEHSIMRIRMDMFEKLQNLSLAYHLRRRTGSVSNDMELAAYASSSITSTVFFSLGPTVMETIIVSTIFFKLGTPFIALTIFLTVALYFIYSYFETKLQNKKEREYFLMQSAMYQRSLDTLINFETVKMFGMESREVAAFRALCEEHQSKKQSKTIFHRLLSSGQTAISTIGRGIAMVLAAQAVSDGLVTPGDFILINTYVSQMLQPLLRLGRSYASLSHQFTSLERGVALLKEPITVCDAPNAKDLVLPNDDVVAGRVGHIRFENVNFSYLQGNSSGGLSNVSFHVPPGKMLALVGASGIGKSTVMRLLLRFYDVDSGSVSIDGVDVRRFTQNSLRTRIGVVAQDTVLFNDTLRKNIGYGKPDASEEEIMKAAQSAALGPFIESLPEGLDTVVGERGVRLSGGERQRVGCARCMIKNPAIVLLDEATSALDTLTERDVQENLRDVCRNRTTIAVAHRLSTIMMADEIIVIGSKEGEDAVGHIIERGSHEELLEMNGSYAEMWSVQTAAAKKEMSSSKKQSNGSVQAAEAEKDISFS